MKRAILIALTTASAVGCSDQPNSAPSPTTVAAAADGTEAGRIRAAQLRAQIAAARTPPEPIQAVSTAYEEVDWLALMPPEDLAALERGAPILHMGQRRMVQQGSFSTVASMTGKNVKLPGYVVPLSTDEQGRLTEFFFVPYFGACTHAPPPPPNQIVYVSLKKAILSPEMWNPQWLQGQLRATTTENALGGSAYAMDDASVVPYDG